MARRAASDRVEPFEADLHPNDAGFQHAECLDQQLLPRFVPFENYDRWNRHGAVLRAPKARGLLRSNPFGNGTRKP